MTDRRTGRRIVVHAGFHKTGTSTTQATLMQNGNLIWPTHAIVLPGRLKEALRMATLHSTLRDPLTLSEFGHRFGHFLGTLNLGARRGLVISAENLCGLIPGRNQVTGYDAAPALLGAVAQAIGSVWDDADLHMVLTLREAQGWLRSGYWQNLRSSRLTEEWEDYAARLAPAADLQGTVLAIRAAVPEASVHAVLIEGLRDAPLGPATPVIDAMGLPAVARAAIRLSAPRNAAPDAEVIAQVLSLNRGPLSDTGCRRAKADLLGLDNV